MKTVALSDVIESAASLLGWMPQSSIGITTAQQKRIVAAMNRWVRRGWHYGMWPDAIETEERTVETEEGTGRSYLAMVPGESDTWTEVGTAVAFYDEDPLTCDEVPESYSISQRSGMIVIVDDDAPATGFLEFRRVPPRFSGTPWDDSITYDVDELAYYSTTGECYRCIKVSDAGTVPTNTTYWEAVDFPAWLEDYVVDNTVADLLGGDDRRGRVDMLRDEATNAIADAYATERDQQGLSLRAGVAAR
jgi:hypothetical protein